MECSVRASQGIVTVFGKTASIFCCASEAWSIASACSCLKPKKTKRLLFSQACLLTASFLFNVRLRSKTRQLNLNILTNSLQPLEIRWISCHFSLNCLLTYCYDRDNLLGTNRNPLEGIMSEFLSREYQVKLWSNQHAIRGSKHGTEGGGWSAEYAKRYRPCVWAGVATQCTNPRGWLSKRTRCAFLGNQRA